MDKWSRSEYIKTPLSASEVQEIYNGGRNFNLGSNSGGYVSSSNLIGYWKMNEGSGSTLIDHSGNSGNAIIHNGPSWLTKVALK